MKSAFIAALLLAWSLLAGTRDSYVYVHDRVSITNGAPVSVKRVKARYGTSFFWFTRDGRTYVMRDEAALRRVRAVYAPLFDGRTRQTPEQINKRIEVQLQALAGEFVRSGLAR